MLRQYRLLRSEDTRARAWSGLAPALRAAVLDAAGAAGRDPEALYETLRPVLAGGAAIDRAAPGPT